ncbi:hypothetical protein ABBQ38_007639 [Trebouxia sp. C0009 RCD-2024]
MITSQHSRALILAAAVLSFAVMLDAVPMFAQTQSTAASEAATAIAKAKLEAATAAQNAGKKKFPVTREDMVVAMPVDQAHLTIAHASRVWRKGVRTYVAGNSPAPNALVQEGKLHNETWSYYPDDAPLRSLYGGDTRAALVPYLAHASFGDTYKWLLYGDDDTVWFMESVMKLLQDFDPDLPYFITDHMWWASSPGRASHPNPEAPRCLPCDFDDSKFDHSLKPFNAPKGCPCTAQLICESDERGIFNQYCDVPKAPMSTYSMHGGAGGIISIGMLRAVSLDYMEKCVKSLYSTGGDAFISICTWQAGYAMTDPGYSFFHPDVNMFDPGPEDRMGNMMKLVRALDHRCDDACQHQLSNMLTLHVRSRVFPQLEDAAQFIKAIIGMYDVFMENKRIKAAQAVANLVEVDSSAAAAAVAAETAAMEADVQALTVAEVEARQPNSTKVESGTEVSASKQAAIASAQQAIQARAVADATDAAAAVALQNAAAAALAKKQSHRKLQ